MSDWPTCYEHVFRSLEKIQGHGNGRWDALCPAHDDSKRSLSVAIGREGRLLLKCHAPHGCGLASILSSLGMGMDDLFPDNRRAGGEGRAMSGAAKFQTAYDYRSKAGQVLFQVCRWVGPDGGKRFSQRRPNKAFDPSKPKTKDNPEWINSIEGVERVVYRLPELARSLKENPDRWVLVVEGEKDADLCWRNGMVATTNPMGALKWQPGYSDALAGCNVAVIPDEDPLDPAMGFSPGLKHAEEVCASLQGKAKKVILVRLPSPKPNGDLSDWWATEEAAGVSMGERKQKLGKMFKEAAPWKPGVEKPAVFGPDVLAASPPAAPTPEPLPVATPAAVSSLFHPPAATAAPLPRPSEATADPAADRAAWLAEQARLGAELAAAQKERDAAAATMQDAARSVLDGSDGTADTRPAIHKTLDAVAAQFDYLQREAGKLRSPAEFFGALRLDFAGLERELAERSPDWTAVREYALQIAAMAAKGLADLPELAAKGAEAK